MKFISSILSILFMLKFNNADNVCNITNQCINFSVGQGTGCEWMCTYCSNQLSSNNYYFTDGVCTYQSSGCVGNPIAGKIYTCCTN